MINLIGLTLLLLPTSMSAPTALALGPLQALQPAAAACRGQTCNATVNVFPSAPELQVSASHIRNGQAATPYSCNPCLDCQASVTVRLDPSATGSTATVWEWGRIPTPDEEEAAGGIPFSDLGAPGSAMRRTLTGPCGGIIPVGPGSSILTVDLRTPTGQSIVTVWLGCFC